jgi:4a-hydroxytetrahydrobiopterin dehydratase
MSTPLADRSCTVCKPGTPTLPRDEAAKLLRELDGWTVENDILTKTISFQGFMPGVRLTDRIAELAESEGHHPDLHLSYGSLRIDLTTHAAGGLTENDFVLAAKIDRIRPA